MIIDGFTRQETIALTGLTSARLHYFDRTGLVKPKKYGKTKRPICIYSWEQLLQLIAIKDLRRKISLQTVRTIIDTLGKGGFSDSLRDKHLVVAGDTVLWVEDSWKDFPEKILTVAGTKSGKNQYVFAFMITIDDLITTVWKNARKAKKRIDIESFEERAKATPTAA